MEFRRRITLSGVAALLIHVPIMVGFAAMVSPARDATIGLAGTQDPIVLDLQPPPAQQPRRLIDTAVPADEPVDPDTDLISDRNANASDPSEVEGGRQAPHMERESDFDEIGGPATPSPKPASPPPEQAPQDGSPEPEQPQVPLDDQILAALEDSSQGPREEAPERRQVAQAQPPVPPQQRPAVPRGRLDGGVKDKGFVGFEAHSDEMAPYLKELRRNVEAQWRALLQTRFSGSIATKAVLDCAISPDGRLVHVRIVDPGNSPTYAPICKLAIEKAAPFGAFPIEVPDIYQSKNLEIRWTFSFFM